MSDDSTLGGYFELHQRPPAFQGSDGAAYSAAIYVDDTPDARGRFGGALLFVRWSTEGDRPVGHLETGYLVFGESPGSADAAVRQLTLHQVKDQLDDAIRRGTGALES